jgi:tRNA uracil 4-sulfurtransferase
VPPVVLVRYGELALKSAPVRREFERTLRHNILQQFLKEGETCRVRSDRGHLYVETSHSEAAVRILRRVFGVTSVSEVWSGGSEPTEIIAQVLTLADGALKPGSRFAVRARRTGQHPFTSQELGRDVGAAILAKWPERGLKVDLDTPEVQVHVEVRGPVTYLYFGRASGPGGLPLGVAGRVVALVDGPRGALGAYLMMKRGCSTLLVATPDGEPLARNILAQYDPRPKVVSAVDAPAASARLREALEADVRSDGIVLPLHVEDYAEARALWGDRVIFSPTVGLTDPEVVERWRGVEARVQ